MAKEGSEKQKKGKTESKPEDDFQYIVRIANTDIDGNKKLIHGLTSIKGIGRQLSTFLIKETGLDHNKKMGHLKEKEIEIISDAIINIQKDAPHWMLNHRKEYDTGENIHLIGPQIDLRLRDEINIMKMIRSYKGIRHERGLTVRGQRTRANGRRGLTLGVSRSRGR